MLERNNKRIAKNTLFLYIRMALVLIVSLYTTRIVLNALGVIDYGINNVVCGFVSMFAFLNASMSNGIQRFYNFGIGKNEDENSVTKVYNTALLIQVSLAFVILFLLETIGLWYINYKMIIPIDRLETANYIYQLSSFALVFLVLQIPYSSAIMAYEKMDYYAIVSIIEVLLRLGIAIVLPHIIGDKLLWFGILTFFISVITFLLYYAYSKIHFAKLKSVFSFDKSLFKEMMSFSGWNILGTFAYMLKGQGLNILLNAFFGPVVNAARGISNQIMGAIQGFSVNITVSFRPQLVQAYAQGDLERSKKLMYSSSKISYLLLTMFSIPIIMEVEYILNWWLKGIIPEYTIPFTILVLANMVISSLNAPLTQIVHATGKMKVYQITTSLVICSILPLSWIGLHLNMNPTFVFWVSLFITIVNQVVCMLIVQRIFPYNISEYCKKIIFPCLLVTILSLIIPLIITQIMPSSFLRVCCTILVSIIPMLIFSYLFALDSTEKVLLFDLIKKIKK